MRCAYLTMDDMGDFVSDADLSLAPMAALGWNVDMVPWRDSTVSWNDYDAVYICTPWDYPEDPAAFLRLLDTVEASSAKLVNPIELVRWSLTKDYLRDIESQGAAIVPSIWRDSFDPSELESYFHTHDTDTIVFKPTVGANAQHTYVVTNPPDDAILATLADTFAARAYFVQPFVSSVVEEGEYSIFFIGGDYSHTIRKRPVSGDFRTQEEYGADISPVTAPDGLIDTAGRIMSLVHPKPVYVRADFVRGDRDEFLLMELELIEPSLYFRMNPQSADRFATAIDQYVRGSQK